MKDRVADSFISVHNFSCKWWIVILPWIWITAVMYICLLLYVDYELLVLKLWGWFNCMLWILICCVNLQFLNWWSYSIVWMILYLKLIATIFFLEHYRIRLHFSKLMFFLLLWWAARIFSCGNRCIGHSPLLHHKNTVIWQVNIFTKLNNSGFCQYSSYLRILIKYSCWRWIGKGLANQSLLDLTCSSMTV